MKVSFVRLFLLSAAMASSAHAITVTNGSFEQGAAITGGFDLLAAGDNSTITGWTVLGPGGVDYVDPLIWDASDGTRSVELSGVAAGGVSQVMTNQFVVGQNYIMQFDMSANPFAVDGLYSATVSVTGAAPADFSYLLTALNTPTSMAYQSYSYAFTATSATKTIEFRGSGNGVLGIVLDNVSIEAVAIPEPGSWAMLLMGFGLVGSALRRSRKGGQQQVEG